MSAYIVRRKFKHFSCLARDIWNFLRCIKIPKCLRIYPTISCETPSGVLRNTGWELLAQPFRSRHRTQIRVTISSQNALLTARLIKIVFSDISLTLQCRRRCIARTFNTSHAVRLGATRRWRAQV